MLKKNAVDTVITIKQRDEMLTIIKQIGQCISTQQQLVSKIKKTLLVTQTQMDEIAAKKGEKND